MAGSARSGTKVTERGQAARILPRSRHPEEFFIMSRRMTAASRIRRTAIGLALTALAIAGIATPWTWAGIVPLVAGATGWCPFQELAALLIARRA